MSGGERKVKIRVRYRSGLSGGCAIFDSFDEVVKMMEGVCMGKHISESGEIEFNVLVKISPTQEVCAGEDGIN